MLITQINCNKDVIGSLINKYFNNQAIIDFFRKKMLFKLFLLFLKNENSKMTRKEIESNLLEAQQLISKFIDNSDNITAIQEAGELLVSSLKAGHKVISCGNGGSMSDAMHFAEELSGRFRESRKPIAALSISDPTHISCTANDYGYDYIFSRYVEAIGQSGDVLLAISTSGNSENIIQAVKAAKAKKMVSIALTGKNGGKLAGLCDHEIRIPHFGYADRIQEMHIKIIHSLIQYIESKLID